MPLEKSENSNNTSVTIKMHAISCSMYRAFESCMFDYQNWNTLGLYHLLRLLVSLSVKQGKYSFPRQSIF